MTKEENFLSPEAQVRHMQIIDCPGKGEICDWCTETVNGRWDGWGEGKMKQRRCTKCGTVNYLEFTDKDGVFTDIRKKFELSAIPDSPEVLEPLNYYKG